MKKLTQNYSKMTLGKFIKALFTKATPNYIKLMIVVALGYTFMPLDFLPDIFGPLGFADDAAVIGLLTTLAMHLLENFQREAALKEQTEPNIIDGDKIMVG